MVKKKKILTYVSREEAIRLIKKNGFKNFKPDRHSYIDESGQGWLQCKFCCEYQKVDNVEGYITCGDCVVKADLIKFKQTVLPKSWNYKPTGRPPGWHFMKEFVDKDGNVFHKGKERPELKGTLEPTKVKPKRKKKKLTEDEKLFQTLKDHKKRLRAKRGRK
jgi:hypothetical protein